MRPRTPREIARPLVTTDTFYKDLAGRYEGEEDQSVEFMVIYVFGVRIREMRYDGPRSCAAANAKVEELKRSIERALEEVGPELAASLAERSA